MKWSIKQTVNLGIGSAAIIVIGLQTLSVLGSSRHRNTYVLVAHISEVKEGLNLLVSTLKDLETAER
jgi:hypothetical protein